jgi:hypothetical protein
MDAIWQIQQLAQNEGRPTRRILAVDRVCNGMGDLPAGVTQVGTPLEHSFSAAHLASTSVFQATAFGRCADG